MFIGMAPVKKRSRRTKKTTAVSPSMVPASDDQALRPFENPAHGLGVTTGFVESPTSKMKPGGIDVLMQMGLLQRRRRGDLVTHIDKTITNSAVQGSMSSADAVVAGIHRHLEEMEKRIEGQLLAIERRVDALCAHSGVLDGGSSSSGALRESPKL
ncbi:uncharacterized protein LOC127259742 [Andrographis paniculata]|uniref:uncharacterized protein LOC127259742 n=1 Tax=Andrographis paniculata TaxID=175694 RepID=UPI0021E822D7|nr:uncharacterized protein LOC127259742 [Andrographis paniculata]